MAEMYCLASYPKSGNTWLRILLANYQKDGDVPADINSIDAYPIASSRVWFDEWAGIESTALPDELIERLRPEVYRCMAREEKHPIYMKVHDAWALTGGGEGLFPKDVITGAVYVVRNPLDMAASCANHWGVSIEQAVENLCNPDYLLARSLGGMTDQLLQKMGTWSNHVCSWIDRSALPVHLVRYEDMRQSPVETFSKVVVFCGLKLDKELVTKAVRYSAFDQLQKQESEKGFSERSVKATAAFFRKGRVGGWREELSAELVRRIIAVNGETMHRFGYLDEKFSPL